MPQFVLEGRSSLEFRELDGFTRGYIEALFFTNTESGTDRESHSRERVEAGEISELPGDYGIHDLAPETLEAIKADCEAFQKANESALSRAYECDGYSDAHAGGDFWYTRNGHGVGFWDRSQLKEAGVDSDLTEASEKAGGRDVYMGDESLVYLS